MRRIRGRFVICPVVAETYPVASGLRDIFTDLLGGETKRTDFRSQRRRGTNFTTGGTEVAAAKNVPNR